MAYFPPEKVFHAILCAECLRGHTLPGFMRCAPRCFVSADRGQGAILAECHRKSWLYTEGQRKAPLVAACRRCHTALPRWVIERRLAAFAARQRKAPLVQRGDSMAQPCRGDCEAKEIHLARFCCPARQRRGAPAAVSLFAIAGCICLGKESFGCGATPPTKPGSISQRGSAVWVQRHAA